MNVTANFMNMNLYEALQATAHQNPNSEILIVNGTRDKYFQFLDKVDRLAAGLNFTGIEKGDKVGIILPTCPEVLYAYFALLKIGAPFIPINPDLRSFEVQYILKHSDAKAIITVAEIRGFDYLAMVDQIRSDLPNLQITIQQGINHKNDVIRIEDLLQSDPQHLKSEKVRPDEIAAILYTSGTTGFPKGVVHSHQTFLNMRDYLPISPDLNAFESLLAPFPLFNAAGIMIVIISFLTRKKLILPKRFNPAEVLSIIESEKVTQFCGAPTMMRLVMDTKGFENYDLSSLRIVSTGGSTCSPDLVQAIQQRFGCDYYNLYAMTEAGIVSSLSADDPPDILFTTVGRPIEGVDIKIVGDQGESLSYDQPGEIAFRSPSLMLGYFNDPVKSKEAISEDGYYFTGDMGSLDEKGYLKIFDRKIDIIIRGSQNIFPTEIENYLNTHPKIKMSAVISVPSRVSGEKARAYVQLVEGEQMTDIEVAQYCRGKIAGYKIPEEVCFVDNFVLTRMGKVDKKVLREEL